MEREVLRDRVACVGVHGVVGVGGKICGANPLAHGRAGQVEAFRRVFEGGVEDLRDLGDGEVKLIVEDDSLRRVDVETCRVEHFALSIRQRLMACGIELDIDGFRTREEVPAEGGSSAREDLERAETAYLERRLTESKKVSHRC